jgi:hypothetical protein
MAQLDFFRTPETDLEPLAPNTDFIRRDLRGVVGLLRRAEIMPWKPWKLATWQERFPALASNLPADEASELVEAFECEVARLTC